jgi:hypothetical protein
MKNNITYPEMLSKDLDSLNNEISSQYSKEKMNYNVQWASNGLNSGVRVQVLLLTYTSLVKTNYTESLSEFFDEVSRTNNKLSRDEYTTVKELYTEHLQDICNAMSREFNNASPSVEIGINTLRDSMVARIISFIDRKQNLTGITKDEPAIRLAKRANFIAFISLVVSIIAVALSILIK